jgi:hypothetical protein
MYVCIFMIGIRGVVLFRGMDLYFSDGMAVL